jgi:alcohol dehydrogenase
MACGDKKAAFRVALLDPKLTVTQPPRVTALTGIDAISHALESYVTIRRTAVSQMFSREAWRLMEPSFPRVLQEPDNLEARAAMQLGACWAGLAIENSMLGATHALANPLTQHYDIPHGQAIALMLPHVIRFNGQVVEPLYRELWDLSQAAPDEGWTDATCAELLADAITQLIQQADLPTRLSACGVEHQRLGELSRAAAEQWTGKFNPRQVDEAQLLALYQTAL